LGDRAVLAGGHDGDTYTNIIQYATISTLTDALDFGDLVGVGRSHTAATSNGPNDRFIVVGGYDGSNRLDIIEYMTISTLGNSTDFGNLTLARNSLGACSNSLNDRGVFAGGAVPARVNIIDYITISTTANADDFGDLTIVATNPTGSSNGELDLGIMYAFDEAGDGNHIDSFTISTLGNSTDWGTAINSKSGSGPASNGTGDRGTFAAGAVSARRNIEYITFSISGSAAEFGEISTLKQNTAGYSNGVGQIGVNAGGVFSGSGQTRMEYWSITTLGDAVTFGDLAIAMQLLSAASNAPTLQDAQKPFLVYSMMKSSMTGEVAQGMGNNSLY